MKARGLYTTENAVIAARVTAAGLTSVYRQKVV
jgi:hypothetical protein